MTIFQRPEKSSDKTTDADTAPKPAARETSQSPVAEPTIIRRPQPEPVASVAPTAKTAMSHAPASHAGAAPAASVISKALKITGQLESSEDIQIDGQIDGDVRGVNVKVGQNAKVKGTVYGDEVELAGTVEGKIEARKVILSASAHMSGDVVHQDIRIESGAYIDGHCKPEFGKTSAKVRTAAG